MHERTRFLGPSLLLVATLLSLPQAGRAVQITYELAVRSPHVWRGITLREFPVLNASATVVTHNGFAAQLWLGIDLEDDNGRQGEIQEIDLDLSYTWDTEHQSITLGFVELFFPGGIDETGELYAKWQSKRPLRPRFEIFYNVDLLQDTFALFSLSHPWRPSEPWAPTLTASVAYAGADYARFFGGSRAGLHHWSLQLDFDLAVRHYDAKFRLAYSQSLDDQVLPDQPARLWGGLYLSLSRSWERRRPR